MRNSKLLGFLILAALAIGALRSIGIRTLPVALIVALLIAFACGGWHAVVAIGICGVSLVGVVLIFAFLFGRRGGTWF